MAAQLPHRHPRPCSLCCARAGISAAQQAQRARQQAAQLQVHHARQVQRARQGQWARQVQHALRAQHAQQWQLGALVALKPHTPASLPQLLLQK